MHTDISTHIPHTHIYTLFFQTHIEQVRKQNCMHACMRARTHRHTCIHTKVHDTFSWKTNHGNHDLAVSLSPSRQSGHLINVTQHPILLHCVFLHSVPVGSPEARFHCKLLFSGKLSKAFDWREGEKPLPELPHTQPPPPVASLWCFIQHHCTHKSCSESRLRYVILG